MRKTLRGIGRFFAIFFTILLTLALICQLTYVLGVISIRQAFTPENVYNYMNSINYATLELPDGNGGTASIATVMNKELYDIGLEITPEEVNSFIMLFSVDDVAAGFAQDFRAWLLDFAPEPRLDPQEITDIMISGLDSESYNFMKIFGDPEEMLYTLVNGITSKVNLHDVLEPLDNLKTALSLGALSLVGSGAMFVLLIILLIEKKNILKTGLIMSVSGLAASGGTLAACAIARMNKNAIIVSLGLTESLYNIVYEPCDRYLTRNAKLALMGSAALVAIFGVSLIIVRMIDSAKNKSAKKSSEQLVGGAYGEENLQNSNSTAENEDKSFPDMRTEIENNSEIEDLPENYTETHDTEAENPEKVNTDDSETSPESEKEKENIHEPRL